MSDPETLASLWQEAIKQYEEDHDCSISVQSRRLTPEKILNDTRFQLRTVRSRHKKLISAFEPFYETLSSVSLVIGHGLKLVYPPAEVITAAVLVLVDGVQRTSESFDAIAEMLDDLCFVLDRYKGYTASTVPSRLKRLIMDGLVHTLHIVGLSTTAAKQGRFRTFLKTLLHRDKNIHEAMHKLDKLSTREGHTVSAASFSATNEILKITEDSLKLNLDHSQVVQSILIKISDIAERYTDFEVQSQSSRAMLKELRALATPVSEAVRKQQLKRLNRPTVFSAQHDTCLPGTRPDILQAIHDWVDDRYAPNIFWLYGHPGTGKSTIATTVRHVLARDHRLGAACFFRRDDAAMHLPLVVWRFIVHDLADKHSFLAPSIIRKLEKNHVDVVDGSAFDVCKELIIDTLAQEGDGFNDSLVIIIDALDEFGGLNALNQPQRDLLQTLIPNWKKLSPSFKLLITSRDQGYIGNYLHTNSSECVALKVGEAATAQSSADIRTFFTTKFADIASYPSRIAQPTWKVSDEDLTDLVEAAAGLFIWASTVVKMVANRPTVLQHVLAQVRGRVGGGTALDGLGHLYKTILGSIYGDFGDDDLVSFVIGAVVSSCIPLSCQSLARLLDIDFDDILVITTKLQPVLEDSSSTLRFSHKSFVDYLISASCSERFRCNLRAQDERLSLACFSVMARELRFNMGSMKSSYHLNEDYTEMDAMISSQLAYACRFWALHVPDGPLGAALERTATEFMDKQILFWLEVLSILSCFEEASTSVNLLLSRPMDADSPVIIKARDALSFLRTFLLPMSQSYPHIYLSALAFAPPSSEIRQKHITSFPWVLKVSNGLKSWPRQLAVLRGHRNTVNSVAFSPEGTRIISGSDDCTIRLWDVRTQHQIGEPFRGHQWMVNSVAFSSDGTHIVSGSYDRSIRMWDTETQQPVGAPLTGHQKTVNSVAFSRDSSRIVSGSDDCTIRLWDVQTQHQIGQPLRGHEKAVSSAAFSPDGTLIVSGSADCTIRLWDAATLRQVGEPLHGHHRMVNSVAFSSDGTRLVSGSSDTTIRLWDVTTRQQVSRPLRGHQVAVMSVAFSRDETHVVSGSSDCIICLWDTETQQQIGEIFRGHQNGVRSVMISPDGSFIVSGSADCTIRLWDAKRKHTIDEQRYGHEQSISSVSFSPDGTRIVSGSWDSTVRLWDPITHQPIGQPLQGHEKIVSSVAFSPDGTRIVSGSYDKSIRLWNAQMQQSIGDPLYGHTKTVSSVAFSPDGARIASGSWDNTVCLWDAVTHRPIGEPLQDHEMTVPSVTFSPDGTCIVTGVYGSTIRLWNAETKRPIGEPFRGHDLMVNSVAFSPDGTRIVSGFYDNTISLWDITTHQPIGGRLYGHSDVVNSVAFSPDGARIVSGSQDKTIRLWNAETQEQIGLPFYGHLEEVTSVSFSPDASCIVSGSRDHDVRLWDARHHPVMVDNDITRRGLNPTIAQFSSADLTLTDNGWVIGPSGERLFWLSESLRTSVQRVGLLGIMGRPILNLDLSQFSHGESWKNCYGAFQNQTYP